MRYVERISRPTYQNHYATAVAAASTIPKRAALRDLKLEVSRRICIQKYLEYKPNSCRFSAYKLLSYGISTENDSLRAGFVASEADCAFAR